MNNFSALDSRNRRNLLAHSMNAFSPPFNRNYSTDATDMKTSLGDSLFINTVHLIPEPMKMNLADSIVTLNEKKLKTNMAADTKINNNFNMTKQQNTRSDYYPSLAGITNFFSGVFNVMGAMFQKRANSPVQFYDCFEQGFEDHHQMTPSSLAWQTAKHEDQNINGRAQTDEFANETYTEFNTDMSNDFRSIAAHCEDKLNRVRLLLNNPQVNKAVRTRRPKRAFHEAGSVEELFEDAFNPEDFISLANETILEYCSPFNHHHEELQMVEAPKVKTETMPIKECIEIGKSIPSEECGELKNNCSVDKIEDSIDTNIKGHIVSSCEDKVSQLKALLQSRRTKKSNLNEIKLNTPIRTLAPTVTSPVTIPSQSEPQHCKEVIFASEIELPVTPESPCVLDPSSYFDEVTGRFYSSSATDSEDSFQIVFSDSPQNRRKRLSSDCESEDSFIVFEETPDSCYTSNDVFGDDTNDATNISDSEDSDSDCGSDLDSGLSTIALSHSLTRTFGDLTDGSLYEDSKSEDVVDCAFRSGIEIPGELVDTEKVTRIETDNHTKPTKKGLLIDDARKREKKKLPAKKVQFSSQPPKVHVMRVWAFAARQARAGHWERHALDRERFKRRIADVEVAISWVLKPQHRSRVMFQRFMPWWNAQKRKELAERKQKEEEEKLKREQEEAKRLAMEEEKNKLICTDTCVDNKLREEKEPQNDANISPSEVNNDFVNNVNCKISRNIPSESIEKSNDSVLGNNIQVGENKSRNKTNSNLEIETASDDVIVRNNTGIQNLCNGNNNVNSKTCNDSEDSLLGHIQKEKEKVSEHILPLKNIHCGTADFLKDDLEKNNGDVTLENNEVLRSKLNKLANEVSHGQHERVS